jgi:hypothetical protein
MVLVLLLELRKEEMRQPASCKVVQDRDTCCSLESHREI